MKSKLFVLKLILAFFASVSFAEEPDAFVEYIQSDGSQFIDTGVEGKPGIKIEMVCEYVGEVAGKDYAALGARYFEYGTGSSKEPCRIYPFHMNNGLSCVGYGDFVAGRKPISPNKKYTVTSEIDIGRQYLEVDGAPSLDNISTTDYRPGGSMYLFAVHIISNDVARFSSPMKCYGLKIWEKSGSKWSLARHFLPCRKGGAGALYDRVSQEIFTAGQVNGKSFSPLTFGNDATPEIPEQFPSFVESHGDAYIDTEVVVTNAVNAKIDVAWRDVSTSDDRVLVGCRASNQRLNPLQNYLGKAYYGYDGYLPTTLQLAGGKRYAFDSELKPGRQFITCDGATIVNKAESPSLNVNLPLYVFACNQNGTATYYDKAQLYGLKIWRPDDDGEVKLVRWFEPAVLNGVAGLYDHVSLRFFAPKVGALTTDDISTLKPNYIFDAVDSDGTTETNVVDLGVRADLEAGGSLRMKTDMAWLKKIPADDAFLCARSGYEQSAKRLYMYHYWNKVGHTVCAKSAYPEAEHDSNLIPAIELGKRISVDAVIDGSAAKLSIDGAKIVDNPRSGPFITGLNFYLFGVNIAGQPAYPSTVRLFRLKFWKDGKLVRDFYPAKISLNDDCAYLYDRVEGRLFDTWPNKGALRAFGAYRKYDPGKGFAAACDGEVKK